MSFLFVLFCFCFFSRAQVASLRFRIISCDLLCKLMCAYMFVLIAVAGPSWLICSAKFLSLYLLGTILKYCFLTFDMLTPLIILATSADGIFQYLIRYNYKNNSTLLENLQILQNKAAKIILDRHPQSSASEALDSLGWKSLHLRRRFHRCTTIFKCLNGFIDFTFVRNNTIHN